MPLWPYLEMPGCCLIATADAEVDVITGVQSCDASFFDVEEEKWHLDTLVTQSLQMLRLFSVFLSRFPLLCVSVVLVALAYHQLCNNKSLLSIGSLLFLSPPSRSWIMLRWLSRLAGEEQSRSSPGAADSPRSKFRRRALAVTDDEKYVFLLFPRKEMSTRTKANQQTRNKIK